MAPAVSNKAAMKHACVGMNQKNQFPFFSAKDMKYLLKAPIGIKISATYLRKWEVRLWNNVCESLMASGSNVKRYDIDQC